ncbi:MAG: hypothetical protein IPJ74_22600 [Saprospiraceae bacterium]|nr:hypothetical protein [Saprospiraceae bacterium]
MGKTILREGRATLRTTISILRTTPATFSRNCGRVLIADDARNRRAILRTTIQGAPNAQRGNCGRRYFADGAGLRNFSNYNFIIADGIGK